MKKKRQRAARIFETLDPLYTIDKTALSYRTPFELLVATILSAQCTDKQVNRVTETLFKKYRSPEDFINAPISQLEQDIHSTGFYRNKTRSIKNCSRALIDHFGGKVPATMDELITLPGVGRKTANCVLGAAFGVPGVVVDTHVKRLSMRLGLADSENPDKIEQEVEAILPKERWRRFSDLLIYHGRAFCTARKPDHARCVVAHLCPSRLI